MRGILLIYEIQTPFHTHAFIYICMYSNSLFSEWDEHLYVAVLHAVKRAAINILCLLHVQVRIL